MGPFLLAENKKVQSIHIENFTLICPQSFVFIFGLVKRNKRYNNFHIDGELADFFLEAFRSTLSFYYTLWF